LHGINPLVRTPAHVSRYTEDEARRLNIDAMDTACCIPE
jgi:hypothetical protein